MSVTARVPGPLGTDSNPGAIDAGTLVLSQSLPPTTICRESPFTPDCANPEAATVPTKERSGSQWVSKFPGSSSLEDLSPDFRPKVKKFFDAIRAAGGTVVVNATYRPRKRAYLMHYSLRIAKGQIKAEAVPSMDGVDIEWVHESDEASVKAAKAMVKGYRIVYPPALISRHTERGAIDMTVTGVIGKKMNGADGKEVEVKTESDLHAVGKKYGVIKLLDDEPHWSDDGH